MHNKTIAGIIITILFCAVPALAKAVLLIPLSNASDQQFTFDYQDQIFVVPTSTVAGWRGFASISSENSPITQPLLPTSLFAEHIGASHVEKSLIHYYHYRPEAIYSYIKNISATISHPAQEPKMVITNSIATEFTPPQDGVSVDVYASTIKTLDALENSQPSAMQLVTSATQPNQNLAELNSLGIKELVGHGVSTFKGSPNNRRHNIDIGVEKMKGIIVAPGDIFSFNKYLGAVDGQHGFLPELVIKATGTVPEFGGGLCQVSSTTFRAAMDAGLPIAERRNHAYAVQYYAPQGTDATIYPGVVDLKFQNDTPAYLLIWPYFTDKNTLVFDFYGTKDNRQVTLEKPVQYDKKTDGSMKATWTRLVTKDGQTSTSTFNSVYRSPALYHKTEEFGPSSTPLTIVSTAGTH